MFAHGSTFGGHPVAAAVAMKNLDIMQSEKINEHVREKESVFRKTLEKLYDIPIVGNIRGEGFFYGIELVKDKETRESFSAQESERILRGFISQALFENGIYCRTDDRGDPVVQLAPALIANETHFDEIESILRNVLTKANDMVEK
jgi:adenosylmethionine-8-amino-7-oxononanoate aminotransferase